MFTLVTLCIYSMNLSLFQVFTWIHPWSAVQVWATPSSRRVTSHQVEPLTMAAVATEVPRVCSTTLWDDAQNATVGRHGCLPNLNLCVHSWTSARNFSSFQQKNSEVSEIWSFCVGVFNLNEKFKINDWTTVMKYPTVIISRKKRTVQKRE